MVNDLGGVSQGMKNNKIFLSLILCNYFEESIKLSPSDRIRNNINKPFNSFLILSTIKSYPANFIYSSIYIKKWILYNKKNFIDVKLCFNSMERLILGGVFYIYISK